MSRYVLTIDHGPARVRRPGRFKRLVKRVLIGNLILVVLLLSAAWALHRWAGSSEERFQHAIAFATQYMLVPAGLVDDHGVKPEQLAGLVGVMERVVVGSVELARPSDVHQYWQARLLMVMPAVWRRMGRPDQTIERGLRSIGLFEDLARRHPGTVDYRRRLAVANNTFADELAELGRHDLAMEHRRRSIGVAEGLLREQPGHWRWRWYVATAELGIATSLEATGRTSVTAPHLAAARAISRELCAELPDNEFKFCDLAKRAERAGAAATP